MSDPNEILKATWPRVRERHLFPELPHPEFNDGEPSVGLDIKGKKIFISKGFVEGMSPMVDPQVVKSDYQIQVPEAEVDMLQLEAADQARVFVVVAVPQDISRATVNLKGPIVINPNNRMAKQVVLMDERYETKYAFLQALQDQNVGER